MKKKQTLSALERSKVVNKIPDDFFDLIVIGGGITGAGIALDAASRGLKTLLLEKQDFGAGTSSRSTKLIHGGLRYLKQLEIGLVREVGTERAILHDNAPHIVQPEKMLLPIIEEGSLGKRSTSLGLMVYDWLAGVEREERRSMHTKERTIEMEPLLRTDILRGGGLYYEYQTDDARLVIEVLKTALRFGAKAVNYTEVTELEYQNNKVVGVQVYDQLQKKHFKAWAKKVVNACGPWVDDIRIKDKSMNHKRLQLTKGVHLVVPYEKLPIKQAVYFDVLDGRMIFAIPRGKTTYFGTTDTVYETQKERPQVLLEDAEYLLDAVNNMFPSINLTIDDVISSWAGLRPLIHEDGKAPSELSRKDEIFYSDSGLISIAGGKLTGFRKMAERTVDAVIKALYKEENHPIAHCVTDIIPIGGGDFRDPDLLPEYIDQLTAAYKTTGIEREMIADLVYKYGKNTEKIYDLFNELNRSDLAVEDRLLIAELHYGVKEEMVTNLSDFLIRRTARLYFERSIIQQKWTLMTNELNILLQWTAEERKYYEEEFLKEYDDVLSFVPQKVG